MNLEYEYQVDIGDADHSNRNEVLLAKLLERYEKGKPDKGITSELIGRYLQAVRRRNGVRRNWQPGRAYECDLVTLSFISKRQLSGSLGKRLQDALTVTVDGKKSIPEECIEALREQIMNDIYNAPRKKSTHSPLETIVRRIRRSNPNASYNDVINEMKANQAEYGIVEIDDETVVIEVPATEGSEKDTKRLGRSLSSIRNIITKINKGTK